MLLMLLFFTVKLYGFYVFVVILVLCGYFVSCYLVTYSYLFCESCLIFTLLFLYIVSSLCLFDLALACCRCDIYRFPFSRFMLFRCTCWCWSEFYWDAFDLLGLSQIYF